MRYLRTPLRQHELTEQQLRVLRALAEAGPQEPTELARLTFLLAPSLSRILRDLSARQLIGRRASKTDLRRSTISLTPAGSRLVRTVAPLSKTGSARISQRFGKQRVDALQSMLKALEASLLLNAVAPRKPKGPLR